MRRYLVFEPAGGASPNEKARFLRDGFSWGAFLLPFVWLARQGSWGFAALVLLIDVVLLALRQANGLFATGSALLILVHLALALEGPRLVAARLRRSMREAGPVYAADRTEAELLYFASEPVEADEPVIATTQPPTPRAILPIFGWRNARTLLDAGARK